MLYKLFMESQTGAWWDDDLSQLSVKTANAEPSGRAPGFVFRQKNDAA
jgi:hypothetical protein